MTEVVFVAALLFTLAFTCAFLGANLGASLARAGEYALLALIVGGTFTTLYVAFHVFRLTAILSRRWTGGLDMQFAVILVFAGLGIGNIVSVRFRLARAALRGALLGMLAGIIVCAASFMLSITMRSPILPVLALTLVPALVGTIAGYRMASRSSDPWDGPSRPLPGLAPVPDFAPSRGAR